MGKLFGEYIRERREALCREDPRYSIRKVAQRIRVHHSYLSKIERGEPGTLSEKKVVALASELGESPDLLLAMNGRVSEDVARTVLMHPDLFRNIIDKLRSSSMQCDSGDDDTCLGVLLHVNSLLDGEHDNVMRHELRSPLSGIISAVDGVLAEDALNDETRTLLEKVRGSGRRLLEIVDGALTLALVESGRYAGRMEAVDVLDVAREVCRDLDDLARSRGVAVRVLGASGQDEVMALGARRLCRSVLSHLLRNALEASPGGGTVTLEATGGEACEVTVHNAGVVPQEAREHFFERYFSHGKDDGVGLGTYAARRLARAMGGEVFMETDEQWGTTLTLRLPSA